MDDIAAMYGFNDHALQRLNERIKDALDPKGILAPGKQGIWPAGLRGAAAAKRGSQT
jgi:4-cresol dehydrogenase (hydroxylating)